MINPEWDGTTKLNPCQAISCKLDRKVRIVSLKLTKFSNLGFKIFKSLNITLKFYYNVERFFARKLV